MTKKKSLIIAISIIFVIICGLIATDFLLENRDKTVNYGTTRAPISPLRSDKQQCRKVNREGLDTLNAHGSGTINFNDFMPDYKGDMNKVYVMNLIPNNLYYYKNRCLKWYGLSWTEGSLGKPVYKRLKRRINKFFVRLFYGFPPVDDRTKLQTEEQLVKQLGAHYFVPLKNVSNWAIDHSYMDNLVEFFKKLPEDAELYIHCYRGKGRTTTFLVLYDIFKNHKKVPLIDIVNRHYCIGRENLFDTVLWKTGYWTQEGLNARKNLIEKFYDYMNAPDGYPHQTWSEWGKDKKFDTRPIKLHRSNKLSASRQE